MKILPHELFITYFSPYSAHSIIVDGKVYPTVEHAYQCSRYTDHELRKEILLAKSTLSAWEISSRNKDRQIADFKNGDFKISIMKSLMQLKVAQHEDVRKALIDSRGHKIVKHIFTYPPGDGFWDDGINGEGLNHIGNLWMEIRDEEERKS